MSEPREPDPRRGLNTGNWIHIAAIVVGAIVILAGYSVTWACNVSSRLGALEGQAEAVLEADEALRELDAAERIDDLERALPGASSEEGTIDGEQGR